MESRSPGARGGSGDGERSRRWGVPSDTLDSNRLGKQVPGKYFARLNVFTEHFYLKPLYSIQPCIRHIENRLDILLFTYSIQSTCQRHWVLKISKYKLEFVCFMFLHKSIKHKSGCHYPPVIAKINCSDMEDIWIFTTTGMMWNFSLCLCVWIDLCFIAPIKVYSCSSASEWWEDSALLHLIDNWQWEALCTVQLCSPQH